MAEMMVLISAAASIFGSRFRNRWKEPPLFQVWANSSVDTLLLRSRRL
jgi:hypothetical protein